MAKKERGSDTDDLLLIAHRWRQRIQSPDATEADHAEFETWMEADPRHEDIYGLAVTLWEAFGEIERSDLDPRLYKPALHERVREIGMRLGRAFQSRVIQLSGAGIAAALVAFAVLPFGREVKPIEPTTIAPVFAEFSTGIGETREIVLEDGSLVTLGAASVIETEFSGVYRNLRLVEGEAYFAVAQEADRPFSVKANNLTATALGTEFNVSLNGSVFRVGVAEGDVKVAFPFYIDEKPTALVTERRLSGGEQITATIKGGLQTVRPINASSVAAWRSGQFIYDGVSLNQVVADLNRYSETPIVIDRGSESIGDLRVRGGFKISDLDGLLNAVELIHPVTVDQSEPEVITLRSRGD
ncbi:MAG: FecR domain-containing protein [Pseudomonadota bacterium]